MGQLFISTVTKHYNLRHHIESKPSPVYLVIKIENKQRKIPLGVKVLPQYWRKDKALISYRISELDNNNNDAVNKKIIEYDAKYSELISYLCTHPNETENINQIIEKIFGMKKKNKTLAIATMYQLLYDRPMKDSSKVIYLKEVDEFSTFLKTVDKSEISIDDIDSNLMKDYIKYLQGKKDTHKITRESVPIEDNTVHNKFGILLTILNYAQEQDLFDVTKIVKLKSLIKKVSTSENQVYLNNDEINRILGLNIDNDELNKIRDIFIFQMEIGQRFSDVKNLMGNNIKQLIKDGMISIIQKKTNKTVHPPVTDIALSILEKYDYVLPIISHQKVNEKIKDICKEANINELCPCVEYRGGKPYNYNAEKWQLISTHSARRSFVSNNIKEGIDSKLIKAVTGHNTDSAFNLYNRNSNKDLTEAFMRAKGILAKDGEGKRNPDAFPAQIQGVMLDDVNTMKKILMMLGENPIEVMDITDAEILWRRIAIKENELCEKIGCDFKTLKDIFNSNTSLKDKIDIINGLITK